MNIYLLTTEETQTDLGHYDAIMVAAPDENIARLMHPYGECARNYVNVWEDAPCWASKPENVTVELIGTAKEGTKAGILMVSFINAV